MAGSPEDVTDPVREGRGDDDADHGGEYGDVGLPDAFYLPSADAFLETSML